MTSSVWGLVRSRIRSTRVATDSTSELRSGGIESKCNRGSSAAEHQCRSAPRPHQAAVAQHMSCRSVSIAPPGEETCQGVAKPRSERATA